MEHNSVPAVPNHRGDAQAVDNSGGHISYLPTPEHPCTPPDPERYPIGTRWTCDTCRDFWEVRASVQEIPHHYWDRGLPYPGHLDAHQPIGRTVVVLLILLALIGAGIAVILSVG